MSTPVFVERDFHPPISPTDVTAMAAEGASCMQLYRIEWKHSYLAADGSKMLCHFLSPDVESARMALRQAGPPVRAVWAGTVHDGPAQGVANVVVEREFDNAASMEAVQALEDEGAHCLEMHSVTFLRTFFSADQKQMFCLYQAPDAESVRLAQRQAKMPVKAVWACQTLQP